MPVLQAEIQSRRTRIIHEYDFVEAPKCEAKASHEEIDSKAKGSH
jgi:hypothetical protein